MHLICLFIFFIYTVTNLKFLFKNMVISTVRHGSKIFHGYLHGSLAIYAYFYVPTKRNNMGTGTCTVQNILMQYYHGPNGFTWVRTRSKTLSYILTFAITCSLSCYLNLLMVSYIKKSEIRARVNPPTSNCYRCIFGMFGHVAYIKVIHS